jgi:hypothetical protein
MRFILKIVAIVLFLVYSVVGITASSLFGFNNGRASIFTAVYVALLIVLLAIAGKLDATHPITGQGVESRHIAGKMMMTYASINVVASAYFLAYSGFAILGSVLIGAIGTIVSCIFLFISLAASWNLGKMRTKEKRDMRTLKNLNAVQKGS